MACTKYTTRTHNTDPYTYGGYRFGILLFLGNQDEDRADVLEGAKEVAQDLCCECGLCLDAIENETELNQVRVYHNGTTHVHNFGTAHDEAK